MKETYNGPAEHQRLPSHARAILAVRHGREFGELVAALRDAPIGDLPRTSMAATLSRLAAGKVTVDRDHVMLEALAGLAERLSLEIVGRQVEHRFVGYDEDGEGVWVWEEVPAYTARGEEARSIYVRLERFLEVRQELIDPAKAERLAQHLLNRCSRRRLS